MKSDWFVNDFDVDDIATDLFGPGMIDPQILSDAKHPTVESRTRLPLIEMRQSPRISLLNQILALIQVVRKQACESTQARQEFHHAIVNIIDRTIGSLVGAILDVGAANASTSL